MTRLLLLLVCHATAVVLRRTPLTPLKVTGRDAGAFLHAMLSADVSTLPQNAHVDACLLTGQSTLTDLITIARCQEEWLLLCEDSASVVRELEKRRVMEDVTFTTRDAAVFDVLKGDAVKDALADTALSLGPTAVHKENEEWALGGTSLREAGGRIITNAEDGDTDAWERARVEKGRPRSGFEFSTSYDSKLLESCGPLESGLAFACAEAKCYLGAELVGKRRKAPSLRCRLRGLRFSEDVDIEPGTTFGEGVLTSVNGRNGLAFIERKAGLGIGDVVTVSGVPATLAALEFGDGLEDNEEEVVVAEPSEKERKAAKLKAMQAKLAAAGLAKAEESEAERKARKLAAMREKLAAAGLAPADDSSEPDAEAAEAARKAAKLQAMREKLAAAGLAPPD
jgi:folate-binding Fe-S cluster repair protein YgfZ